MTIFSFSWSLKQSRNINFSYKIINIKSKLFENSLILLWNALSSHTLCIIAKHDNICCISKRSFFFIYYRLMMKYLYFFDIFSWFDSFEILLRHEFVTFWLCQKIDQKIFHSRNFLSTTSFFDFVANFLFKRNNSKICCSIDLFKKRVTTIKILIRSKNEIILLS